MSALFALAVGALSLRTRGVYFIMITLAFAQMAYYVTSGLSRYGGDDGLTIYKRSSFGGLIDLSNRVQFARRYVERQIVGGENAAETPDQVFDAEQGMSQGISHGPTSPASP